eukprot:15452908-Alexandrium_andersonii.AAC.1
MLGAKTRLRSPRRWARRGLWAWIQGHAQHPQGDICGKGRGIKSSQRRVGGERIRAAHVLLSRT